MEILKEIISIFKSEHPFKMMLDDISLIIVNIWNYCVFETVEQQKILVSNIVISLILLLMGLKLAKILSKLVRKKLIKKFDISSVASLERVSHYFFIIVIAIFVLDISNVPLTVFKVVGTTLAIGIGLGSQNIANNFISGLLIMIERPVKLGDIIEVKGVTGQVTDIGARCISIRTDKNINILIPNSNILQDSIINWTHEDTILKHSIEFAVEKTVSLEELDQIILKALDSANILKNPEPKIMVVALCEKGYEIEVDFWIDLATNQKAKYISDNLYRKLAEIFKINNINVLTFDKDLLKSLRNLS